MDDSPSRASRRTNVVIVSKVKRSLASLPVEADPDAVVSAKEDRSVETETPPQGDAPGSNPPHPRHSISKVIRGDANPASRNDFSPGKPVVDPPTSSVAGVAEYLTTIWENWRRGVHAILEVARLCAEAEDKLTTAQKGELISRLPFRRATFSKLAQVGADQRLRDLEIQSRLPPHYSTLYQLTLLDDPQFDRAIKEGVIYADLKRDELQRWCADRLPRKAPRRHDVPETQEEHLAGTSRQGDMVASAAAEPQSEPDKTTASPGDPELKVDTTRSAASQKSATDKPVVSPTDQAVPGFLEGRPLSPADQEASDLIVAAWDRHVQPLWAGASEVVHEHVRAARMTGLTATR
jgi:hypothetical protein